MKSLKRYAAEVWAVLALLLLGTFCVLTPPFHGADEIAHAERAIQIAHGHWVASHALPGTMIAELPDVPPQDGAPLPTRVVTAANPAYGAAIDTAYLAVAMRCTFVQRRFLEQYPSWSHRPDGRFSLDSLGPLRHVRWSRQAIFVNFQNTAVYPPPLYLPAAVGWATAERLRLTILQGLYFSRVLDALCAVFLGWLALRLAGPERLLFGAILLLPATLTVESSCSQDAILLPLAVLIASILTRTVRARRTFLAWELAVLIPAFALCVAARPPYLWLVAVLAMPWFDLRRLQPRAWIAPVLAIAAAALLVGVWRYLVRDAGVSHAAVADPAQQILFLRTHPARAAASFVLGTLANIPVLAFHTVEVLETRSMLTMAAIFGIHMLSFATILWMAPKARLCRLRSSMLLYLSLFAVIATISIAEYLIWNAPGSTRVEGIQARYLLPLLAFLALVPPSASGADCRVGTLATLRMPLLTGASLVFLAGVLLTPVLLAHRYYGVGLAAALHCIVG